MSVFFVAVTKNVEAVEQRFDTLPQGDVFKMDTDKFAVAFNGLSQGLSEKWDFAARKPMRRALCWPSRSTTGVAIRHCGNG